MSHTWRPTASLQQLRQRAALLEAIRQFFKDRGVLEVETPLLAPATVTDPSIESIVTVEGEYLQTSPEYAMKRLLAAGYGSIFQISKAFRREPCGKQHQREFTLLEWYRPGFNHYQLMDEIDQLLQTVLALPPAKRVTYQALFEHHFKINPHQTDCQTLAKLAQKHDIDVNTPPTEMEDWLMILLTHHIEPTLQAPTFIYDYPRRQAALAKIEKGVAQRFELYIRGIELANGFHELTDPKEQARRFEQDLLNRQRDGLPTVAIDHQLLAALDAGLPNCAGVALGIDRLLMMTTQASSIAQTISFAQVPP